MTGQEGAEKKTTNASVVRYNSLSAGPVHAVFKSAIPAWRIIYGDLLVAESIGSALTVAISGHINILNAPS